MRLRLETAKRLRALGARKKSSDGTSGSPNATSLSRSDSRNPVNVKNPDGVRIRRSRIKEPTLADPPLAKAKFRKRQKHKSWLPTHIFHAKRAHLTPPSQPLWRFAVPLSPTVKCYRPTHRAATEGGAVVWDCSYHATIGIHGQRRSLDGVLRGLSITPSVSETGPGRVDSQKWYLGTRVWSGFAYERETPQQPIAPVVVIWSGAAGTQPNEEPGTQLQDVMIRVHPSAFLQLWQEILRLSKIAKPQVKVEDLRFEIGSIEITGPGSTEALLGALWPLASKSDAVVEKTWVSLAGLTNPAMLPVGALLGFEIQDPRLHHPPRTIDLPKTEVQSRQLLQTLAEWPIDKQRYCCELFDRQARSAASSALSSQKAINRRKALAVPGKYPESTGSDPRIPVLLYCASSRRKGRQNWTLLLPWKCVQPVWYSIIYYPLSTGGQPRFGGLEQMRQLSFESGRPWFPADFPGTQAGMAWEKSERVKRQDAWRRRPKSKRTNWDSVDLGEGRKGEIGDGWSCDWEGLIRGSSETERVEPQDGRAENDVNDDARGVQLPSPPRFLQLTTTGIKSETHTLAAVRIVLLSRGVPETCARVYRLPKSDGHRKQWLAQHPAEMALHQKRRQRQALPRIDWDMPAHVSQRLLAQSLLEAPKVGQSSYPLCPSEEDLIGFITTGNFNLSEGRGTGIGNILWSRVDDGTEREGTREGLCIVRNAGQSIARLARWELALSP